jgi:polyhydroxybutyrate depolymerase
VDRRDRLVSRPSPRARRRVARALFAVALVALVATGIVSLRRCDSRTIVVNGVERSYDLVVEGELGSEPVPLVFVFHGRNGSGAGVRRRTGIADAAHEAGDRAIFVFPEAVEYPGEGVLGWQVDCDGPDMRFADAIVREVASEHAVDRTRIFASGFSWGAEMAIAFGCCRHHTVRAVAPMSGATSDVVSEVCRAHAPAFRITIGDADPIVRVQVVRQVTGEFRARHGCSDRARPADPSCLAYEDCEAPVIECVYPGLGHEVPPNGGREIWRFLRSFESQVGS